MGKHGSPLLSVWFRRDPYGLRIWETGAALAPFPPAEQPPSYRRRFALFYFSARFGFGHAGFFAFVTIAADDRLAEDPGRSTWFLNYVRPEHFLYKEPTDAAE